MAQVRRDVSLSSQLFGPFSLAATLLARHWPMLLLISALGLATHDLLIIGAVEIRTLSALSAMIVLSLVVLVKLVTVVASLMVLRPSMPAIRGLRSDARSGEEDKADERQDVLPLVAAALLPFFAYYAAWGFLSDTVREYSRLGLSKTPFGEKAGLFDVLSGHWVLLSIGACWVLRWGAKRVGQGRQGIFWPALVVACDATWVFIGLYALSSWQDELMRWIGSGDILRGVLPSLEGLQASLSISALAASTDFVPVELRSPGLAAEIRRLFFFILLPLVWLVMTAIIFGYDFSARPQLEAKAPPRRTRRWLADFFGHFIDDYRSRYMPVFRAVGMALQAGVPALVCLVIGYQLIAYVGSWAWMAGFALAGERPLIDLQLIASTISLLFGSPSDQNGGILLDPLRFCLLAAVFELAVRGAKTSAETPDRSAAPVAG